MRRVDTIVDKTMRGQTRKQHRSSHRRHRDFYDAEEGRKSRYHRPNGKECRLSKETPMVPQQLIVAHDSTMQIKPPCCEYDMNKNANLCGPSSFMLPLGCKLSPRSDIWLLLSLSSLVTLSSIATSPTSLIRTTPEMTAMITTCILLTISTIIGTGYRYAPFRDSLTWTSSKRYCRKSTKETIAAALCLSLSTVVTVIVMKPSLYIAVGGHSVWNVNLFFSSWLGLYSSLYLVADLITTKNRSGLVDDSSSVLRGLCFHSTAKIWWVLLGSTIFFFGVLLDYANSVCTSTLSTSNVCESVFAASILEIFSLLLNLSALAIYRISLLGLTNRSGFEAFNGAECALSMFRRLGTVLSCLVFVLKIGSIIVVSSQSGPGMNGGSIFVTAWVGFGLSLNLLKTYIESFCLPFAAFKPKKVRRLHKHFDDSFRTIGTSETDCTSPIDISSSDKLTDEESQDHNDFSFEHYYIEQHMPDIDIFDHQEITQRVPSRHPSVNKLAHHKASDKESLNEKPNASNMRYTTNERESRLTLEPPLLKASFASKFEPMIIARAHCDVSTIGTESLNAKESARLESKPSFYDGIALDNTKPATNDNIISSPIMSPLSITSKAEDRGDSPRDKLCLNNFKKRASYCSIPSLQAVPEASRESSSSENTESASSQLDKEEERKINRNRKSATRKTSKSSKVTKSPKVYKHKIERRGSEESTSPSDAKTMPTNDSSQCAAIFKEFSIACNDDSKSIVTEITEEGFDEGCRQSLMNKYPPRLPNKNPLYNGSVGSDTTGISTREMKVLNSSVDDLVAYALSYARKAKLRQSPSLNSSSKSVITLSPSPSTSEGYLPRQLQKTMACTDKNIRNTPKIAIGKAKHRGSIQSMYSYANSEGESVGKAFAC